MSTTELHVYTNDEEWVIAASPEDADAVCADLGMGTCYSADASPWTLCDPAKPFRFDDDDAVECHTFAEWITIKGRGYFASSNY